MEIRKTSLTHLLIHWQLESRDATASKKCKSRCPFLTHFNPPNQENGTIDTGMTQILHKRNIMNDLEPKIGQDFGKSVKREEYEIVHGEQKDSVE